jgi:TolB protein
VLPTFLLLLSFAGCGGLEQPVSQQKEEPESAEAVEEAPERPDLKGTIVFVSDRGGVQKIWSMPARGTRLKRLTRGQNRDAWPRFSPDGRQILYTSFLGDHAELWLMNRDGSSPAFITNGEQAEWAPDGRTIAFLRDQQVHVRDLASGDERRLAAAVSSAAPVWNPHGKTLAISTQQPAAILLIDMDGKKTLPLNTPEPCHAMQWSRDGRKILCQTAVGHIAQVDPSGKNWEELTEGADLQQQACYSPDGSRILFCRAADPAGPWQLYVKDLAGDNSVQLTRHASNWQPDWHAVE